MPVATYGAMKGVTTLDEQIILSNTYHLRNLNKNVKKFVNYNKSMLTDSGGFQIGSLPNVVVKEEGVLFNDIMFTPENSIRVQKVLGADIAMQLDEVVNPCDTREKLEVGMRRSLRWLDRCIDEMYYCESSSSSYIEENREDSRDIAVNTQTSLVATQNVVGNIQNAVSDIQKTEKDRQISVDNIEVGTQSVTETTAKNIGETVQRNAGIGKESTEQGANIDEECSTVDLHIDTTKITHACDILTKRKLAMDSKENKKKKEIPKIHLSEKTKQILFPIIQGGLYDDLRKESIDAILQRSPKGLAIGGLSGGEEKIEFAKTVLYCTTNLPDGMRRYLMGVGYPEDILVCVALGSDMSDCVYPARTARFGRVFTDNGPIKINNKMVTDERSIDECGCYTCGKYSRAYLATINGTTNYSMLLSIHNLFYMRNLTRRIREAIMADRYPEFIKEYMNKYFTEVPQWIVEALLLVNVDLRK